ncbi:MAG TPA: hypothetical protein VGL37_02555 [Solirubrobacteraceae bacterium]
MTPSAEDRADIAASAGGVNGEANDDIATAAGGAEDEPERFASEMPARFAGHVLAWLLPGTNPAGAIYGMIAIGALLAAESGLRDTYLETLASALIALALYWLAHAYADMLGQRVEKRAQLDAATLGRTLLHDWTIVRGGVVPLLVLLVCWAAGASQETAVTVDLWVTAGSLLTYELLAGLRARSRPAELLLEGCVGAAMGIGILALRVVLH